MSPNENRKTWITDLVNRFLAESPLNNLKNRDGDPAWSEALVGFASGVLVAAVRYRPFPEPG